VIALAASAPDAIADLAARGLAAAILSESMVGRYRDRLTAVRIEDVDAPAQLALVWRRTHNPAVREFLRYGRRAFGKHETSPDHDRQSSR
jgi:DNA-binding transcriptional LysR family regulator